MTRQQFFAAAVAVIAAPFLPKKEEPKDTIVIKYEVDAKEVMIDIAKLEEAIQKVKITEV